MNRFLNIATSSTNSSAPISISGTIGLIIIVILLGLVGILLVVTIIRSARKQMNLPRRSTGEKQPHIDAWTESGRRSVEADQKPPPPPRPSIRENRDNSNDDTDMDFEIPS